jgi:hypothetical protein
VNTDRWQADVCVAAILFCWVVDDFWNIIFKLLKMCVLNSFYLVHCVSFLYLRNTIGRNTLKIHNPNFLIRVTVFMKMLSRINISIIRNSKKRVAAAVSPWSDLIPLEILSFIWRWWSKQVFTFWQTHAQRYSLGFIFVSEKMKINVIQTCNLQMMMMMMMLYLWCWFVSSWLLLV